MGILRIAFCLLGLVGATSAQTAAKWDFERGDSGWTFFGRATDSANGGLESVNCHAGASCYSVEQRGGQDWAFYSSGFSRQVRPGEIWNWSVWAKIDTITGSAGPTIAAFDSAGKSISWSLASGPFPKRPTGWAHYQANLVIPSGCTRILPRLTGWGPGRMVVDDIELVRTKSAPTNSEPLVLANDSLRLVFDPLSLGMTLHDSIGSDSVVVAPLTDFSFDSLNRSGTDSARWFGEYAPGEWPIEVGIKLHGGEVRLSLHADSARILTGRMLFPGAIATRKGQRLAMPRGTGITVAVDETAYSWSHRFANFWQWQVSMALAGATDGKTGFVASIDQPSDAGVSWNPKNGLLQPSLFQVSSKGVWMHDRTLLIAPLRGNGWKELAGRHRARQTQLGRVRDWKQKIAANPAVDRLRGAMDFWVNGNWGKTNIGFFDTLRMYGVDKALIQWGATSAAMIDSLNHRGFLTSLYTQAGGALRGGSGPLDREIPDGIALDSAGNMIDGFQVVDDSGNTTVDHKRVSILRQQELLRTIARADLATHPRNARFIDVTLAEDLRDDYNPRYPSSRMRNMDTRIAMLGFLKDTLSLVVGSEQARDFAHAVVDYGEGPMSIASTPDAPFDWTTPVASTDFLDSMSFDPSRRIPLLPLSNHDAFAPTWYTGDGQSKIPSRWNAKDAWNILYGTMALIQPDGRTMWDSLQSRYLRSILLVGAAHDRYGFEPMTEFVPLSDDWRVQRTTFGNGWTVTANLDSIPRESGSATLAGNGFLATDGKESIGRILSDGAAIDFVRLSNRWYFDPEGSVSSKDGVRTSGGVSMTKSDDTTVHLAFVGPQATISLRPEAFPWKADGIRAYVRGSDVPARLSDDGEGWLVLARSQNAPFYTLHGDFDSLSAPPTIPVNNLRASFRLRSLHGRIDAFWEQSSASEFSITVRRIDGSMVASIHANGAAGSNAATIPVSNGFLVVELRTPDGTAYRSATGFR